MEASWEQQTAAEDSRQQTADCSPAEVLDFESGWSPSAGDSRTDPPAWPSPLPTSLRTAAELFSSIASALRSPARATRSRR
jgi:hypothetical protein